MKALRGTKRVCNACATRFYDLSRDPIVCPSCGALHAPDAPPAAPEAGARAARLADKTGWRGRDFKLPEPEPDGAPEAVVAGDGTEEALAPGPSEDVVLDEEPEEADLSGLVGHHDAEPKEG
jgi:uncharacterized protein (TIGR02300 family)